MRTSLFNIVPPPPPPHTYTRHSLYSRSAMPRRVFACLYFLLLVCGAWASPVPPVPTKPLSPGVDLPYVGLGTWQYDDAAAAAAVSVALSLGYTHIDTAFGYRNARGVRDALRGSNRTRSSYFITTKVPPPPLCTSLSKLQRV